MPAAANGVATGFSPSVLSHTRGHDRRVHTYGETWPGHINQTLTALWFA